LTAPPPPTTASQHCITSCFMREQPACWFLLQHFIWGKSLLLRSVAPPAESILA
jgi:hypothetical protein